MSGAAITTWSLPARACRQVSLPGMIDLEAGVGVAFDRGNAVAAALQLGDQLFQQGGLSAAGLAHKGEDRDGVIEEASWDH